MMALRLEHSLRSCVDWEYQAPQSRVGSLGNLLVRARTQCIECPRCAQLFGLPVSSVGQLLAYFLTLVVLDFAVLNVSCQVIRWHRVVSRVAFEDRPPKFQSFALRELQIEPIHCVRMASPILYGTPLDSYIQYDGISLCSGTGSNAGKEHVCRPRCPLTPPASKPAS